MNKNRSVLRSDVTLRAVIIGLLLIPANAYWMTKSEVILSITHATTLSLFFNVSFMKVVRHFQDKAGKALSLITDHQFFIFC
jgi:hypothetical protein